MGKFSYYYEYVEKQADDFTDEYFDYVTEKIKEGQIDICTIIEENVHEWYDNDFICVNLLDSAEILDQSEEIEMDILPCWATFDRKCRIY